MKIIRGIFSFSQLRLGLIFRAVILLFIAFSPALVLAQGKTDTLPDGTEGVVFTVRKADSILVDVPQQLPPNEFTGTHSTFRIGLGYIGDFSSYAYDNTFKQQLASDKFTASCIELFIILLA